MDIFNYLNYLNYFGIDNIISTLYSFISAYLIYVLFIYIFSVVVRWIIFKKAGIKGWKSIIPIYRDIVEWCTFLGTKLFILHMILFIAGPVFIYVGFIRANSLLQTIGLIIVFVSALFKYIFLFKKAKYFNQGGSFAVGLYFLPFIFNVIIAFDKDCKHSNY